MFISKISLFCQLTPFIHSESYKQRYMYSSIPFFHSSIFSIATRSFFLFQVLQVERYVIMLHLDSIELQPIFLLYFPITTCQQAKRMWNPYIGDYSEQSVQSSPPEMWYQYESLWKEFQLLAWQRCHKLIAGKFQQPLPNTSLHPYALLLQIKENINGQG